jgi:hypothetical protein
LTHKTICANEMLKRTTSEKICQKTPPGNGGTLAQATRGTCRLGQYRHHLAAVAKPGMWPWQRRRSRPFGQVGPAASMEAGMLRWLHAGSDSGGMFRGREQQQTTSYAFQMIALIFR